MRPEKTDALPCGRDTVPAGEACRDAVVPAAPSAELDRLVNRLDNCGLVEIAQIKARVI